MSRQPTIFCLCRPPEPQYILVTSSLAEVLFRCQGHDIIDYRREAAEKIREKGVIKRELVIGWRRVPMQLGL